VLASLLGFAVIYGILAVAWLRLVRHLARQPLTVAEVTPEADAVPVY
jgi:cytochrome d ubiquinol oxidase subunit I